MGRSLARRAREVLDMLDARPGTMWEHADPQPSGCEPCGGRGALHLGGDADPLCLDCRGTGHNLRGVLPAVECSAQLRARAADSARHGAGAHVANGQVHAAPWWLPFARRDDWGPWHRPTRVVPRGEHRETGARSAEHNLDQRISERMWDVWGDDWHLVPLPPGHSGPRRRVRKTATPRWRRGELRHAGCQGEGVLADQDDDR